MSSPIHHSNSALDGPFVIWLNHEKRSYEASSTSPGRGYERVEVVPVDEVERLRVALNWALTWIDYCAERPLPEPETDEVEDWVSWQAAMVLVGYPEHETAHEAVHESTETTYKRRQGAK